MTKDPQNLIDEAQRDVSAARAELRGRADQIAADYEERIAKLAGLATSLENEEITARVVQDRVRQLLGERGGIARSAKAGRTQIGMRAPAATPANPATLLRLTPTLAGAALVKTQAEVDCRVVGVMAGPGMRKSEARLELALLAHLRRGIDLMAADLPGDAVLLEGVMEFADETQTLVAELEAGGVGRLRRLLDYLRELAGQLQAAGATLGDIKEKIRRTRALVDLTPPDLAKATDEAVAHFLKLAPESERRLPAKEQTLLDDLLRP